MKISSEAKVGIIGIATIAVLIWGINFLKGRNIFNSNYTLYTFYAESGGVEPSAPVLMNGVKIGYIKDVVLRMDESPAVKVILNIEKTYTLGTGSVAELISADLLGTKAIRIKSSGGKQAMLDQDTIQGVIEPDMISSLQSRIYPILVKADHLVQSLDTLSMQVGQVFSQDALAQTLENIAELSKALGASLSRGGALDESFENLASFTTALEEEKEEMASLIRNLNSISESLNRAGIDSLSAGMTSVLQEFDHLMQQVNSGEGSAGNLFYSDTLHESFLALISNLDSLVTDLNENPEDYVQISLFGKSKK